MRALSLSARMRLRDLAAARVRALCGALPFRSVRRAQCTVALPQRGVPCRLCKIDRSRCCLLYTSDAADE